MTYKVYDYYEDEIYLGSVDTYDEACEIADDFYEDTDGECDIKIFSCDDKEVD